MARDRVAGAEQEEPNVQHPPRVWSEPSYAEESLERRMSYYLDHLRGRSNPASPETVARYCAPLLSFIRFLDKAGEAKTVFATRSRRSPSRREPSERRCRTC